MGVRATGLQSFKHVILFFFGMGTMMDFLKHEGTTDRERDRLKISVKTPASWKAHALSTRPGIPSGPTALRMFTRLKDRVTSATESVSGLTSSAAAAAALSVCNVHSSWFISFKACDVVDALPHASWVIVVEVFFNFVFISSFGCFDGSPEILTGLFPIVSVSGFKCRCPR